MLLCAGRSFSLGVTAYEEIQHFSLSQQLSSVMRTPHTNRGPQSAQHHARESWCGKEQGDGVGQGGADPRRLTSPPVLLLHCSQQGDNVPPSPRKSHPERGAESVGERRRGKKKTKAREGERRAGLSRDAPKAGGAERPAQALKSPRPPPQPSASRRPHGAQAAPPASRRGRATCGVAPGSLT